MTSQPIQVPLNKLVPSPFNVRCVKTDLAPLVASLRSDGIHQNLVVVARDDGRYEVVAGEPRRRAAAILAREGVWRRDQAIPCELKEVIARHGWPTIADVGEQGARDAWLLVQHADNDPAFQLRVLRLMEPLAARGAVPTRNFAYLYDRVTLKISGVQRYGTQAHCVDGRIAPLPLEQPGKLDELRRLAGLPPIAEYLKQFPGKC